MPYMIKSRSGAFLCRDADGKMQEVTPREWVIFEQLPSGVDPSHDSDLIVLDMEDAALQAAFSMMAERSATAKRQTRGRRAKRDADDE